MCMRATPPVRIYAGSGDLVSTAPLTIPKQLWVQAGNHVYFPYYNIQHNNLTDTSIVRAGNGLYFSGDGYVCVAGPGRLEVETGRDFWMPSNAKGITSNRVYIYDTDGVPSNQLLPPPAPWKGDQKAADIAISTGFNQAPDYSKFEQLYLDPTLAAAMEDYLKADAGDGRELPIYLFDRLYQRANKGTDGLFVSADLAKGFVNYMRGLQGLSRSRPDVEQRDYLNAAWDYWLALPSVTGHAVRCVLPAHVEGAGREAEHSSAVLSARASRGSGELRAPPAGARGTRDAGRTARVSRYGVELTGRR